MKVCFPLFGQPRLKFSLLEEVLVILKFRNRKEQAENIKQLLMGKIQKQLMEADFSTPQRQSSIGILVLFFTLQQYARALWPLL
jgi:hypothetical protein